MKMTRKLIMAGVLAGALVTTTFAQINGGVRPVQQNFITQNPAFARNPAALELITNLLAEPEPELVVPEVSSSVNSAPGTYWNLTRPQVPLPFNPYPGLPVFAIGTNNNWLIDDRSVDYEALDQLAQAEAQLAGLTNGTVSIPTINTNGLWIEVPANSLATAGCFTVTIHNAIQDQSYDVLTKSNLLAPTWVTALTVTGAVGNATEVQLPRNGQTNLFVWARMSGSFSFYLISPPLSQTVLWGDTVTFSVETGGNTNLTFQWTFNGVLIGGATNSSYTISSVRDNNVGAYACIIFDGTNSIITAAANLATRGYSDDIAIMPIVSARQDYTFKSGTTYYIGGQIRLYGNTIIEAGTVLKFDWHYNSSLQVMGTLTCKGEPYFPAIMTSINDDTPGEQMPTSSGNPQPAQNGVPYLELANAKSSSISNLRISYADWGVTTPAVARRLDVWDCQFVQCNYGIVNLIGGTGAKDSLHNVLFSACNAAVGASTNLIDIEGEQVTADVTNFCLAGSTPNRVALTNSIVFGNDVTAATLALVNVIFNPDSTNFQATGAGHYYLAANSSLHHAGTANISPHLQSELQGKTTYPPIVIAAYTELSGEMTLAPQAGRYTYGAPDLGYHYDALDYTVADMILNGGKLTVLPGTAIGYRMEYNSKAGDWTWIGFDVRENSAFICQGTPAKPNVFVDVQLVQEQLQWSVLAGFVPDFYPTDSSSQPPVLNFRFSNFYLNDVSCRYIFAYHFMSGISVSGDEWSLDSVMNFSLQDCHIHGGQIDLDNPDDQSYYPDDYWGSGTVSWINNSFDNVAINLDPTYYESGWPVGVDLAFHAYNNLFRGGLWFHLEPIPATAGNWTLNDNFFDKVDIVQDTAASSGMNQPLDYSHNGYWPLSTQDLGWDWYWYPWWVGNSAELQPTDTSNGSHEVTLSNTPPYQAGPFGNYYLPTNTPLYGAGSRTAGGAGLAQYTTSTNQIKEGTTHQVNIGLHYVAATNSPLSTLHFQPLDSDGDGILDYVEDANGNGVVDANETDPNNRMTDGFTPDASNSVYLNIDLSGDGLTGRAKRILGINPLSQDNPLSLLAVPQQGTLSGIVQIPLNIGTNVDTNTVFHFFVDGLEANATIYQVSNNWVAEWDTMTIPNGIHFISIGLTLDLTGYKAFGASKVVIASNAITVDETTRWFTDQLTINANANVDASEYRIEVYDAETQEHLKTLSGDISNGEIQTSWNLQDSEGNRIVDGPLICDFYLTTSELSAQTRSFRTSPNDNSSGSSSASVLFKFTPHVGGQLFTVAYGYDYSSTSKMNALQTMMLSSVVDNLDTLFDLYVDLGGGYDYNLLPMDSGGNVPYVSAWQFQDNQTSINTLEAALGSSANFYWWGHCNTDVIAPSPSGVNFVSSGMVGQILHNNADQGNITHSYRLVILDGCEGYSKAWADAFGIIYQANGSSYTVDDYNNKFHLDPQAFVGWTVDTPAPSGWALSVTGIQEWQNALDVLFSEWQLGYPLNVCVKDYTDKLVSYGFTSDNGFLGFYGSGTAVKQYKISGCIDLTTFDR